MNEDKAAVALRHSIRATIGATPGEDGSLRNIITDIFHSFRNLNLSQTKSQPSPKQQEVQKYEQQVFPQFSNSNSNTNS